MTESRVKSGWAREVPVQVSIVDGPKEAVFFMGGVVLGAAVRNVERGSKTLRGDSAPVETEVCHEVRRRYPGCIRRCFLGIRGGPVACEEGSEVFLEAAERQGVKEGRVGGLGVSVAVLQPLQTVEGERAGAGTIRAVDKSMLLMPGRGRRSMGQDPECRGGATAG
jgi:hypothetical protein